VVCEFQGKPLRRLTLAGVETPQRLRTPLGQWLTNRLRMTAEYVRRPMQDRNAEKRGTEDFDLWLERQNEMDMSQLMRFPNSIKRDPAIENWMLEHSDELGTIAQRWFEVMRDCGNDVRELLHDGHPTACVGDAAFGYVNAFRAHVNVGFFRGAEIADPEGLLEGTGKFMRHVKLRPGHRVDDTALMKLIETAYTDMKVRVNAE
jgi:hypothetical protein